MPFAVALAMLRQRDRWLLQLRDDIDGIAAPGCWGLFGGHLEPGESPETALRRELEERRDAARQELQTRLPHAAVPSTPADRTACVHDLISRSCQQLDAVVTARRPDAPTGRRIRECFAELREVSRSPSWAGPASACPPDSCSRLFFAPRCELEPSARSTENTHEAT